MESMEQKIMDVLNDPEKMADIIQLAKGLGISPPEDGPQQASEEPLSVGTMLQLLQNTGKSDARQEALLQALLPYLRPERQKKLQRALRVAKLTQLAGAALKSYSDQL